MTRPPLLKRLLDGRRLTIGVPFVWLFLFFLLPFLIVLKISFSVADVAIPPYTELFSYADQQLDIALNFGNYILIQGVVIVTAIVVVVVNGLVDIVLAAIDPRVRGA